MEETVDEYVIQFLRNYRHLLCARYCAGKEQKWIRYMLCLFTYKQLGSKDHIVCLFYYLVLKLLRNLVFQLYEPIHKAEKMYPGPRAWFISELHKGSLFFFLHAPSLRQPHLHEWADSLSLSLFTKPELINWLQHSVLRINFWFLFNTIQAGATDHSWHERCTILPASFLALKPVENGYGESNDSRFKWSASPCLWDPDGTA